MKGNVAIDRVDFGFFPHLNLLETDVAVDDIKMEVLRLAVFEEQSAVYEIYLDFTCRQAGETDSPVDEIHLDGFAVRGDFDVEAGEDRTIRGLSLHAFPKILEKTIGILAGFLPAEVKAFLFLLHPESFVKGKEEVVLLAVFKTVVICATRANVDGNVDAGKNQLTHKSSPFGTQALFSYSIEFRQKMKRGCTGGQALCYAERRKGEEILSTLRAAFQKSLPILAGYLFMGFAFGVLVRQAGYSWLWALLSALLVYAGSGQFLLAAFLFDPQALPLFALTTFLVNSRHLFYGLSFLTVFRGKGLRRLYSIFSLTDETYSVLCGLLRETPACQPMMLQIALLHHLYWILGCCLGAIFASAIPLKLEGVDFSMTALFLVIVVEQWKSAGSLRDRLPALLGGMSALLTLLLLGPEHFILPALCLALLALLAFRRFLEEEAS